MKIVVLVFVLFPLIGGMLGAQDYMDQYNRGSLAVGIGNCDEGEALLQEAIKANSKDDFRKNYFPHYYLAVCAMNRNDLELAQKLSKQAAGSGIAFSSLAKEYSKFKSQLEAKLKAPREQATMLAVVVNTENAVQDITLEDLRKIYTGEKRTWGDGTSIVPVMGPEGSPENRSFLSALGNLDEKGIKAAWETLKLTPPSRIEKNEWVLRYVFSNPGAIAFCPTSGAMQQVKVVRVEGKEPSDPAYPISAR